MSFQTNLENYLKFNSINRLNNNDIEDYFKSQEKFDKQKELEIDDIKTNSKFNINAYKSIINTTVLSDMFVSRDDSNFYPEVGMIFLKTYMKQLIDGEMLQPTKMVKVFNKNQELIELPYSVVLYLGGLYYFHLAESEQQKYKKSQKKELFIRIDGIFRDDNNYEFEINKKIDKEEKLETIKIPKIMAFKNYGVQNNFLNKYNKALFGDYLNGENELNQSNQNNSKPHALCGGYLGIIKPIKTYTNTTGNTENYVAIYRSVCVNNYNFTTKSIVDEFSSATVGLNVEKIVQNKINEVTQKDKNQIMRSFVAFSNIKANFLSGVYPTKDKLKTVIEEICKINNITDKGAFLNVLKLNDFYYLLSRVFFNNSINVKTIDNKYLRPYNKDMYTLDDRNQIDSITNLLYNIWSIEKSNLKNQNYSQINDKSVYALYPSCGGFVNPNYFNLKKDLIEKNDDSIKKNTNRFLWFESNRLGLDLINDTGHEFDGVDQTIDGSYFLNNHISVDDVDTNTKKVNTRYVQYYKLSHLMDSFDFEKLEEMTNLFKDFVSFNKSEYIVDSYNLKSLILASSVVTYDDIVDLRDSTINLRITKEALNLMLIGNSIHHYNFMSDYGIAKYLNSALTIAQKTKAEDVCNDFCSNLITIANTSTIGSIRYNTLPELSIHKFQASPEILFSNTKNYDELVTFLGNHENADKYLSRRILFNNQYLDPFDELTNNEKKQIIELNKFYLYNELYITAISDNYRDELFLNIVSEFFIYLNIKYSIETYKHLFRLIRTFSYNCLKELFYLVNDKLPSNIIPDYTTNYKNDKIIYVLDTSLKPKDLKTIKDTCNKFFKEFNKQTINNTLESNNAFLEKISEYFTDKLNPNSENSFNTQNKNDKSASDIKKTTYYNIKTLYDKFCGLNSESSNTSYIVQKIEDLNKISIENFNKNLFYNLKFSDDECFGAKENIEYDLYQIFQIVDRGNNDIGTKVLADLAYLYENLYAEFDSQPIAGQPDQNATVSNLTKGSFQKLFSGLAVQSGFLFQQIPNYLNLNSAISGGNESFINNVVDDLFGVHTTTSLAGAEIFKNKNNTKFGGLFGLPGYIFQLGTATSSLDNKENIKNNYTNSFCLDIGLDNNREIIVRDEDLPDEIKNSNITCFAVDFSSQKQQMFNNIQLDTNEFYETEESIRVWVDAVNATDNYLQTSNLFPIMEKRSYTCTVTSLGNATIQPLSYFYLRNVPLFNGTYWITNVNHKINDNTMLTTFKGVRQPIISKSDTRKQLLELLRSKADALLKASDNANRVITEGISDTEGLIKQIESSDKPYGSIIQERKDDNGYQEFDAKTLIGSFIYSITNSNDDKDANNLGIIATLYNQAKAYIGSEEHAKIIKNIKNIVVGKIKIAANDDDKRYCQTKSEPSLSVLYKNSGYSNIGKLSSLLDDILNESDYSRLIKLPKNIKLYTLTNTNDNQIQLQIGNEITTAKSENIPINEATIYLDHNPSFIIKSNTSFAGSEYNGKSLTANDILTSLSGNTINVSKQVNDVPIKYLGTFTLSKNVSFYSVNSGNLTFSDGTKKTYDVSSATVDDINQISNDPNKNISAKSTTTSDRSVLSRKMLVKNMLKKSGLSKAAVAGVMGNIQKESNFNPRAVNKADLNGFPSVGLIQWNGRYTPTTPAGGSKKADVIFKTIGTSVEQQINYLLNNYPDFNKYRKNVEKENDPSIAGYMFARDVERCANCTSGEDAYFNDKRFNASDRSKFAKDYFNRFNDRNDPLFWDNESNIFGNGVTSTTKTIEGKTYENGKLNDNVLRPINNQDKYKGAIDSDDGRIRLYTKASLALEKLITAAEADGIRVKINSAYRTVEDQIVVREKFPNDSAEPGTSNHGFGLAVDFATPGLKRITEGDPLYEWLVNNGGKFGFRRIVKETWHWEYFSLI